MNIRQRAAMVLSAISGKGITPEQYFDSSASRSDLTRGSRRTATNYSALELVAKMQGYAMGLAAMKAGHAADIPVRVYKRASGSLGRSYASRSISRKQYQHLNSGRAGAKAAEWASSGGDLEEVTEGPIVDLLARPDPTGMFTAGQMSRLRYLDIQTAGMAFDAWMGKGKSPEGLYRLDPTITSVLPDPDTGMVTGFAYGKSPERMRVLRADEVFWYRHWVNPRDIYDGLSWCRFVLDELSIVAASLANELGFVENGMRPDSLISVPQGTDPKIIESFRASLEQRHRGVSKRATPMIVTGETTVMPLDWAPKDLTTDAMLERMYRNVRNAAGVPESMADLNDANLASAGVGYDRQYAGELRQMCNAQAEVDTALYGPAFGFDPGVIIIVADDPMPAAVVEETQRHVARVAAGLMTINEARLEAGDDPMDDKAADLLRFNGQSLVALDRAPVAASPFSISLPTTGTQRPSAAPAPAAESEPSKIEETALNGAQIAQLTALAAQVSQGLLPLEAARAIAEAAFPGIPAEKIQNIFGSLVEGSAAEAAPTEEPEGPPQPIKSGGGDWLTKALSETPDPWADPLGGEACGCCTKASTTTEVILNADEDAVATLAAKVETLTDDFRRQFFANPGMDLREFSRLIEAALTPDIEKALSQAAHDAARVDPSDDAARGVVNERALARAGDFAKEFAEQFTETTKDQLKNALERGISEGRTTSEIADAIEAAGFSRSRANAVARTELARAHGAGQVEGFKSRGITHKTWDLAPGACPICSTIFETTYNGGEGIPLDEPFWDGGPLVGTDGKTYNVWPVASGPAHPNDRCQIREVTTA